MTPDRQRPASKEGASALLTCYQKAVIHILHARDIPGISTNELESFRLRSRASAYTCRLRSCPRATLGFESAAARDEHEVDHARKFHCTYPSCQYPAFYSSQKLTRHMLDKHRMETPRRTMRQPGTRYQHENDGGRAILPSSNGPLRHMIDEVPVPRVQSNFLNKDDNYTQRTSDENAGDANSFSVPSDTIPGMLPPGHPQPGLPELLLTPEQIAKMSPGARQEYEAMRDQTLQMQLFEDITQEELDAFEDQKFPEVPMSVNTRGSTATLIRMISSDIFKLSNALHVWFQATRDEARLRAFIRIVCSLLYYY